MLASTCQLARESLNLAKAETPMSPWTLAMSHQAMKIKRARLAKLRAAGIGHSVPYI